MSREKSGNMSELAYEALLAALDLRRKAHCFRATDWEHAASDALDAGEYAKARVYAVNACAARARASEVEDVAALVLGLEGYELGGE